MRHRSFTIDDFVNNKELNILKAVLPLLPRDIQRFMAIYIAIQELSNIFALLNAINTNTFSNKCNNKEFNIIEVFEAVKKHLPPSEAESIEGFINMMNMMQMMNEMSSDDSSSEAMNFDVLKSMLNPEQSAIFDTLSNMN